MIDQQNKSSFMKKLILFILVFAFASLSGQTLQAASDQAAAGPAMVKDINLGAGDSYPNFLTDVNSTLYFRSNDGEHGQELWKSDGTAAGTVMVKDINPGSGSSAPDSLTNVNGTLYFRSNDGAHGQELWRSDGSETGTVMVKDINPGSGSSAPNSLVNVNGTLYFNANDGMHGQELWKLDATGDLESVSDIPSAADTPAADNQAIESSGETWYLNLLNSLGYFLSLPFRILGFIF